MENEILLPRAIPLFENRGKTMHRYIAIVFSVLCLMVFSNSVHAQDIAYNFKMPVGYPDGSDWSLNGGWGYMENEVSSGNERHPGEDLNYKDGGNTDCGKEVRAAANGIVTESSDFGTGWGNIIEIKSTLPDGSNVWLIYAHEQVRYVSSDDMVQQGDLIGLVGGGYNNAYPCHLHLEVRLQDLAADYWPSGQPVSALDGVKYTHPRDFIADHQTTSDPASFDPFITTRADATFLKLNPYSGINNEDTPNSKMMGHISEDTHWWFPADTTSDDDGVANNAVVRNYDGGEKVGIILAHPDSNYAVQVYDKYWYVWAFTKDEREDDHNVYIDVVNDCDTEWFADGRGPLSQFGLPITGVYRLDNGNWRQDFQRGYMLWNKDEQELHLRCYEAATPGWTQNGWEGRISAGIARAYERNGGRKMVGVPFSDNNGGTVLHSWGPVRLQNFEDGYRESASAIIVNEEYHLGDKTNQASLVRDGFWSYYAANDGPNSFGVPLGDEMDTHKRRSEYTGFDPYCDDDEDGWNSEDERQDCVEEFCCADGCNIFKERYTSMQRFEKVTLCYDRRWANETMCDPSTANSYCVTAVANVPVSYYGMGGGSGEPPPSEQEGDDDSTPDEQNEPLTECDYPGDGSYMRLEGDLTSWWQYLNPGYVDLNDCVLDYQWVGVSVGGLNSEAECFEFFDELEYFVDVSYLLWWRYTDGTIWHNIDVMNGPSYQSGYCSGQVTPNMPVDPPESGDDDDTPDEPLTECDYPGDGSYMRLEGDLTSWWQYLNPGYVDLNDCVLDYQWVGVSVGGLNSEAECFEFFDQLESAVNVQHLLWWHYTDGTVWQSIDVMNGPSFMTGYCSGMVAPNMPVDPPESGDDDDATESGDDDDATTPEPPPAPPTVIDCVLNWDTAAGVWGGEWKLCWAYPWNPALNTWSATGGLNDQIQYDWSVWFTFGAASQGDANLIAAELQNLVANGVVVFANVNTGAITPWVHADNVTPTPYGGGYRWMLSPSVGSTFLGPSPVNSVNW